MSSYRVVVVVLVVLKPPSITFRGLLGLGLGLVLAPDPGLKVWS